MTVVFSYPKYVSYAVGQFHSTHHDPWFEPTHSVRSPLVGGLNLQGLNLRVAPENLSALPDLVTPHDRLFEDAYHGSTLPEKLEKSTCKYCYNRLSATLEEIEDIGKQHHRPIAESEIQHQLAITLLCQSCGWWRLMKHFKYGICHDWDDNLWFTNFIYEGIIHGFPVEEHDRTLHIIRSEIARKHVDLCSISPSNMEHLVGAVIRDHLGVNVRHVGGPGDGGIDLLVTESDDPIAIQVKRRIDKSKTEPVSEVRHFLGCMMLKGYRHGILATSAEKFSPSAKATADLIHRKLSVLIELYDHQKLIELIPPHSNHEFPWEALLKPLSDEQKSLIHDFRLFLNNRNLNAIFLLTLCGGRCTLVQTAYLKHRRPLDFYQRQENGQASQIFCTR